MASLSDTEAELLADWRKTLAAVRTAAPDFETIRPREVVGEDGLAADEHGIRRATCLWALQYERADADDALVRALFEAETAWRSVAPFQGMTEELSLGAFLLSERPPPDVVWLMWEAKRANFDTWAGFDSRFLSAGGSAEAIAVVLEAEDPDEQLIEMLGSLEDAPIRDADLLAFLEEEMTRFFPAAPDAEPSRTWFDRARRSGDWERARLVLDEWVTSGTPPEDQALSRLLSSISSFADAAAVQERVVRANGRKRDLLAELRLLELRREAGQHDAALKQLRRIRRAVKPALDRNGYKRRSLAEQGFLLAVDAPFDVATKAFALSDRVATRPGPSARQIVRIEGTPETDEWLPLVVLRAARDAARRCGERQRQSEYQQRLEAEGRRIGQPLDEP